jgi:hypothetical protein
MRATLCLTFLLAVLTSGCGPSIDLKNALQVQDVSTGWADLGVVNGQNKLVPSITFRLKNVSTASIGTLQANVIFRRKGEEDEWGSGFLRVAGSEGLAAGAVSQPLSVKSQLGYTGTESRQDMLANRNFIDARAQVFAKYGSTQWTLIGEFPIERRLVTE